MMSVDTGYRDTGYRDTTKSPAERARELLEELTLEEKMAQLTCIFPFGDSFDDMEQQAKEMPYGTGQVSTLEMRRIHTLDEAAAWQRKMQETVMTQSPHHIPAIFHMEGLCGGFIQESTSFPSGIARGSGWDPKLEEKIARTVAEQEAVCGITHILAPVLDISRDSRMGRQGETYGEDPALAAALGAAYTRGVQTTQADGRKPESVAKHFLGFHNSQGGIHGSQSDTPPRLLEEIYGKPFQAAITESGLKGIMPCYNSIDGEPASVSHRLLTELLRERMGFDGLAVSDYGGISNAHEVQHIGETIAETGLLAMEAGMDMEMPKAAGYGEELKEMFRSGQADMELLDRTVLGVLEAKYRMGLFEHPFAADGEELHRIFDKTEGAELSLQSARESMILLKNNGVLPLSGKIRKLAVIGPHADCARKFFGGYTHLCMMESVYAVKSSIAGVEDSPVLPGDAVLPGGEPVEYVPGTQIQSDEAKLFDDILRLQKPECRSLLEELKLRMPDTEILYAYGYPVAGADESGFEEAMKAVKEADAVILTLGGKHGTCSMATMGEGVDAANINLPECQDAFIRAAVAYGKPLIGVHFDGRPISSDTADRHLDAIVEAWSPAESGAQAVADVLMGAYNPGGKLPVSVAYNAGQIPVFYNHPNGSAWHQQESIGFVNYVDLPHTPRYCFGHGLSYTRFAYTDLEISTTEVEPDGEVTIRCTVENAGERAGDEVVQLYLRDRFASMTRPVKELAGFCRIHIEPKEKIRVTFTVKADQTAFLDREMRWKVERGDIDVEIGSSSEDIRLTGEFRITQDQWINGAERTFYAASEMEVER
ncbi:glycoside hydrolase family 3 N-terminal domain-containing protein [Mediterraneibacter glycyrrhizinilyticus]|uniref:glycoside hydrolase family 3 N-terminal domain-containing protein n=1 Tax=Mediterraneibacter glycyrrhizinilyticus TaxID=342942 RepID=UPI0025A38009|nr:glycoside hydrolase family 3 N-terminal domain-containing protein [Mediterraneibacter glycyrrhizinilyticus]MDM8209824.1 glycoside hydrolase family 3 N-terminal domain-containing protein [Mediterraneibacter glycyrrhizinilyticus]